MNRKREKRLLIWFAMVVIFLPWLFLVVMCCVCGMSIYPDSQISIFNLVSFFLSILSLFMTTVIGVAGFNLSKGIDSMNSVLLQNNSRLYFVPQQVILNFSNEGSDPTVNFRIILPVNVLSLSFFEINSCRINSKNSRMIFDSKSNIVTCSCMFSEVERWLHSQQSGGFDNALLTLSLDIQFGVPTLSEKSSTHIKVDMYLKNENFEVQIVAVEMANQNV